MPLTQLYRQMFNRNLYLAAYGRIYSNQGAMTPGPSQETADGMSEDLIDEVIGQMRRERYRFAPARRVWIPKKNGKLRPLGLPSWSDKLVGEVVRLLLEAYYEPRFSGRSHGFRKGRGCHTALREIQSIWTGTTWFIEGDISDCFGSLDHDVMTRILAEKIHDQRFLRLIGSMLKAGFLEDWQYHETLSGSPQGGVVTPPTQWITRAMVTLRICVGVVPAGAGGAGASGDAVPDGDLLRADEDILDQQPQQIKARLAEFLRDDLGLELNQAKTLISHARSQRARFLGYDITVQHSSTKITNGRRSVSGQIALRVPPEVVRAQCARYRQHGKPWPRSRLQNLDDYDIVRIYGAEYAGVVNYYLLAQDVWRLSTLCWHAVTSMLKTLAAKHHSTVTKMAARYRAKIVTSDSLRRCFEARLTREGKRDLVARFGGIALRQNRRAVITDPGPVPVRLPRRELLLRLRRRHCELCDKGATVAVHQVAGLRQLGIPGPGQPSWAALMAKMRRKTLVVCVPCHEHIHANPVAHAA